MKHAIDSKFPFAITAYLGTDGQPVLQIDTYQEDGLSPVQDSDGLPYLRVYVNEDRVSQYDGPEPWQHEHIDLDGDVPAHSTLTLGHAEALIIRLYRLIETPPSEPGWQEEFFTVRGMVRDRHSAAGAAAPWPPAHRGASALTLERADRLIRDLWRFAADSDVASNRNERFFELRQEVRCRHDDPRECPTMAALSAAAPLERAR